MSEVARGAQPGERRGGRKKGVPNRATAETKLALEDLAKTHAPAAMAALAQVALKGTSEAARVAAAVALLDRAYGKPRQSVDTKADITTELKVLTDDELDARLAALIAKRPA